MNRGHTIDNSAVPHKAAWWLDNYTRNNRWLINKSSFWVFCSIKCPTPNVQSKIMCKIVYPLRHPLAWRNKGSTTTFCEVRSGVVRPDCWSEPLSLPAAARSCRWFRPERPGVPRRPRRGPVVVAGPRFVDAPVQIWRWGKWFLLKEEGGLGKKSCEI